MDHVYPTASYMLEMPLLVTSFPDAIVGAREKLVFCAIYGHGCGFSLAGPRPEVSRPPTLGELADGTGLTVDQVQTSLAELLHLGLLERDGRLNVPPSVTGRNGETAVRNDQFDNRNICMRFKTSDLEGEGWDDE